MSTRRPSAAIAETMWAEQKPDLYGGKSGDEVVPQWESFAEGDKQSSTDRIIALDARCFPPGTKVVVSEPVCPKCERPRWPERNGAEVTFPARCEECGFDWRAWEEERYG